LSGLGKTHLCIALGHAACVRGYTVLFTTAIDIIHTLSAAAATGSLKRAMQRYVKPRLLIVDELGYLPIDKLGADLLFQIISERYERGSVLMSTNRATSTGRKSSITTAPSPQRCSTGCCTTPRPVSSKARASEPRTTLRKPDMPAT
jgi:DNA replication protein DnaC